MATRSISIPISQQEQSTERLFMPSYWSKRLEQSVVVEEFVRSTSAETRRAQETIPSEMQQPYGSNSMRETVDLYGTDLPENSPIFVFVSGGYWIDGGASDSGYPAAPLHANGIVSVIVDYDRAPGITLTDIVGEVVKAAQWVLEYAKSRGSRSIVLCGHSAGAHLCAMVVASDWFSNISSEDRSLFKAVIHLSGVFDLVPLLETSVKEPLGLTEEEARKLSPLAEENVAKVVGNSGNLKTLIFVAEQEAPGLISGSSQYAKVLKESGLESVSHQTVPMVDHFDLVGKLAMERYVITKEIVRLLTDEAA